MRKMILAGVLTIFLALVSFCTTGSAPAERITFVEKENQIDVMIDGSLFTSYMFVDTLTKPILWPVHSPDGTVLTRAYPFGDVEGEATDHPHHTGIFFTYDKVNDAGFWNNTTSPPQIKHVDVTGMSASGDKATLSVVLHWTDENTTLLEEKRTMVFMAGETKHNIDFDITLTAMTDEVVFEDTKEGMFAIRVAPWLKERGTGEYLNARGATTEKNVWGRRSEWVRLQGNKDGQPKGIIIMNHPTSINYPTFWHARGYGLFAANPLGQSVFQKGTDQETIEPLTLTLAKGESAPFKFRMVFYDGSMDEPAIDELFQQYE